MVSFTVTEKGYVYLTRRLATSRAAADFAREPDAAQTLPVSLPPCFTADIVLVARRFHS